MARVELAVIAGTCVLVAKREQWKKSLWELSFTFSFLCTVTCPLHFAVAIASIIIGPYCYFSFFGGVGTEYLGYAVEVPFPYLRFPGLCLDPLHYEWYHLGLQGVDLLCSSAIFSLSLIIVIVLTLRLLHAGHVNVGPA
ncbi:hypothetical protein GJAV_G00113500 [Gymnothorax javanicus]|nr:hypothetical protein GJAV_G00113500 [Gymnothorax javanicus]